MLASLLAERSGHPRRTRPGRSSCTCCSPTVRACTSDALVFCIQRSEFSFAVFAEFAFVNVEFMSTEFCVLLVLDFVMLVMRDVRQYV
eukprot:SAG11_NODE_1322_length_5207_cov_3.093187_2_plen_88_part_00